MCGVVEGVRPLESVAISLVVREALCASDDEGLCRAHSLAEQQGDQKFWTENEQDLLLDTSGTQHSATHVLVRKIGLRVEKKGFE